jgi:hypothetical protein
MRINVSAQTMSVMAQRQRELFIYDGRDCLGRIDVAADGEARAFDHQGKLLGRFPTLVAASSAFNVPVEPRARSRSARRQMDAMRAIDSAEAAA